MRNSPYVVNTTPIQMKKEFLQIRVSEAEKAALAALAIEQDRSASQIVREAIKEKVAEHKPKRRRKKLAVETA